MSAAGPARPARFWDDYRPRATPFGVWNALVIGVCAVVMVLPIFGAQFLPFVDYPEHIGTVAAIHGQSAGSPWSSFFQVEYNRTQYWLVYVLSDLLAYLFGVETASRIVVALAIGLLPVSVAVFLKAHGRPVIGAAVSVLAAFHVYLFWGFINFVLAIPVALFALAALAHVVNEPTWKRAAVFGVLTLMCFYAHAQIYAWLAVACAATLIGMVPAVGMQRAWRAAWRSVLAAVPSGIAVLWWLRASRVIERGVAGDRSGLAAAVTDDRPAFQPAEEALRQWLDHSFGFYRDASGETIALIFFGLALLLIALRAMPWAQATGTDPSDEKRARTWAPELVFATAVLCYFFAPNSYKLIAPINSRFLPLALAMLPVLGPTLRLRTTLVAVLGVLFICAALHAGTIHRTHFAMLDDEMGSLDEALGHTRPGKRLLGLIYDPNSAVVPYPTYLHAHQYYQADIGGLASFGFVEFPISPIQYREGAAPPPFPPRFEWTPQLFDWNTWGETFDYFLIRTPPNRDAPAFFPIAAPNSPELVYSSARWKLFAKR